MKAMVEKWGNSLAIRIPVQLADRLQLTEGATVEMDLEHGSLVLKRQPFTLDDLLSGHTASECEIDWGQARWKEVW
jgi:antitoxin MazE